MHTINAGRIKSVRQSLERAGANALLETHLPNVYYLTGFSGDSGALLLEPSSTTLFTDGRFTVQAKEEVSGIKVQIHRGPPLGGVSGYLRRKRGLRVAISPSRITLAEWTLLKKGVGKGIRWVAVDGVVDQLRGVKDASEIGQIREAARLEEGDYLEAEVTESGAILLKPVSIAEREPTPEQEAEILAAVDEARRFYANKRRR